MKKGETISGIILLMIGVGIYLGGRSFPPMPEGHPGPGLFPSGIGILLTICALALIIRKSSTSIIEQNGEAQFPMRMILLLVAVGVFPLLYNLAGFLASLFIIISAVAILFKIKWWKGIFISGLTCSAIYMVFSQLLQVQL